ncbi:ParB/RepB/Spo0J family partition protein [Noviherbaspirillum suwonense]|uniref:Chromosome partitioning protein, ParB family n=1 Tax=Noviherbaspirillum suwonense TaxID=1224511 RepID=A0ABY1QWY6_9BURK|nr:ParB/RepB/Spo0J family partition protein [Noviherbaspirillum suwonense]SMP80290.1 chromosome partitioning protein, ParB family [Noviherbaspirillum suwonense]
MSMKDRLTAKAAGIGTKPRVPNETPATGPRMPRTAPGQLMSSLPFLADQEREIEELRGKLAVAEINVASSGATQKQVDDLRARLEQTERDAAEAASRGLELPLDSLVEVEGRRRKLTIEQFSELVENLRNHVLVQAITVRPISNGKYEVVSGNNRVAAYRHLGHKTIKAVILDSSEDLVELSAFYANLLQPSLPDYEKYLGFKKRQQQTGKTQRELADEAGLNDKQVSALFSFEKLPDSCKKHLDARPEILGYNAAMKLVQAVADGNFDLVVEAVQMLATDSRFTQAQAVAHATKKRDASAQPRSVPVVIKEGKTVVCKIETRGGRVLVDFADAEASAKWAQRFAEFVKEERAKEPK